MNKYFFLCLVVKKGETSRESLEKGFDVEYGVGEGKGLEVDCVI